MVTYLAKPAGDSESCVLHNRLQGFKGTGSRDIIQIFGEKIKMNSFLSINKSLYWFLNFKCSSVEMSSLRLPSQLT
jgi:hypothetical protein